MATEDIKVVTIPQESLQQVDANNNYVIKFRISNEDGSQKSSWSPYLTVPAKTITKTMPSKAMTATVSGDIVTLQWVPVSEVNNPPDEPYNVYRPLYDVFVKWSTNGGGTYTNYEFLDTVTINSAPAIKPNNSVNRVKFKVQVAGLVQEENNNLLLGESGNLTA